ncbi:MAG TPA: tyrosine-type recombinase/integrase [Gemmataceae bacterium]|jgi:integrase|nr:tyrosine-type recombinase/integrase [Gemmataceae bacterium]
MASLELRNKAYRLVFMYAGKKHGYSLDTNDKVTAEALRGGAEKTLMLIAQHLLPVPPETDIVAFVKAGGNVDDKPRPTIQRIQLGKLTESYLSALGNGSIEDNSLATVRMHLKHFTTSLGERFDIQTLTMDDLQKHVNRRKQRSPVTLKKEMASFRACWNWGVHAGKLNSTFPSKGLRYPKGDEKPPFMTRSEVERKIAAGGLSKYQIAELWDSLYLSKPELDQLLEYVRANATQPFVYPLCCLAGHTGMRRSEILRTLVGDLDVEAKRVTVREKKRVQSQRTTRRVPLTPFLMATMKDWLKIHPGGPYLFAQQPEVMRSKKRSPSTGHLDEKKRPTGLNERLQTVRKRERQAPAAVTRDEVHDHLRRTLAGGTWKFLKGMHVLRHSFISILASKGVDQRLVDEWVGHQTEQQRRRYRHLLPSVQEQAILSAFGE